MPLHVGKGRNISTAISDIIDYVENPQKTDFGKFIYGYECDTRLADAEFLLSKRQYANLTGRNQGADDVIAYHLRQAFKPGEVTPEEANQIGRELALKLTKGNHAFVVCTHVDKHHVHNHIIINSTTLDCQKKFRNFWGSTWAIRRMNDNQDIGTLSKIMPMNNMQKAAKNGLLLQSINVLGYQKQIKSIWLIFLRKQVC